ncbi:MAG TPA: ATP-binding protein [Sporichthyaceae bacterium]|nr:ATP-binding protein [Sporichthyaceae bacterium]
MRKFWSPAPTIRLRLTASYAGLFLISGIGLVAIIYALVAEATGDVFVINGLSGVHLSRIGPDGLPLAAGPDPSATAGPTPSPSPTPMHRSQAVAHLVRLARNQHTDELHQLLIQSMIALAIMAVVSAGLGWILAGRVLRPLRHITNTAQQISATSLERRLSLPGPNDEIKQMADTFDDLLARLQATFEAQRQFVANASHELRTPLARQRVIGQVALGDPEASADDLRAAHERILASGAEQERLIEALLTLARGQTGLGHHDPIDLAGITQTALTARHTAAEQRGITMTADLAAAPIVGDPHLIERMIANILDNALLHNHQDGHVEVSTSSAGGRSTLTVGNSGPRLTADDVHRLLRPFQRLETARVRNESGLGLGMPIIEAIAGAHHGGLAITPRASGGLMLTVQLPARETPTDLGWGVTVVQAVQALPDDAPTPHQVQG